MDYGTETDQAMHTSTILDAPSAGDLQNDHLATVSPGMPDINLPRVCGRRCRLPEVKRGTAWRERPRPRFRVDGVECQALFPHQQ